MKKDKKLSLLLLAWFSSIIAFIFIVPSAAFQDYYKIHLLPVVAIFAAISYFWIFDKIKRGWVKTGAFAVFWALILLSVFALTYPIIKYKPIFEHQIALGKKVEEITEKKDLVIAVFGPDPMLLFYCGRKGWAQYLCLRENNIDFLEQKRSEGAGYFVCGNLDEFDCDMAFKQYMLKNYRLLAQADRVYAPPVKYSLDYFIWTLLDKANAPFLQGAKEKLERSSLGYVIFDIRRRQ